MNFTTWRGRRTTDSDGNDPVEDALGDLVRAAQNDLDGVPSVQSPEPRDKGELVERAEFVSFILMAPGYCLRDFGVVIAGTELRVEAPDFDLVRRLGCAVEPSSVRTEYRNGVLSVRVAKKP
ncbi:MAG: hypothetical protein JRN08_02950 [Nitrososphaerota archaeon]|nr:hypothetical protein [Nitrososphaerota archaeon]